jgi:hypothetical protein
VTKEQLKQLIDLVFDTAEKVLAGRPLVVMALNFAQHVVTDRLLDRIYAEASSKGMVPPVG